MMPHSTTCAFACKANDVRVTAAFCARLLVAFAFLLLISLPASAQEEKAPPETQQQASTNDNIALALAYYDSCLAQPDPSVSIETQKKTCFCMADKAREKLTADEIKFMAGNDDGTPVAKDRQFKDIFGPCLEFHGWEYSYFRCFNDEGMRFSFPTLEKFKTMCECIADDMQDYFAQTGQVQLAALLSVAPRIDDPFAAIMDRQDYIGEYQESQNYCMLKATGYRSYNR